MLRDERAATARTVGADLEVDLQALAAAAIQRGLVFPAAPTCCGSCKRPLRPACYHGMCRMCLAGVAAVAFVRRLQRLARKGRML